MLHTPSLNPESQEPRLNAKNLRCVITKKILAQETYNIETQHRSPMTETPVSARLPRFFACIPEGHCTDLE